jgi:mono/diheme cytochrome c family protein
LARGGPGDANRPGPLRARTSAAGANRFNGNCSSCHAAAGKRFDMVWETTHGCAPLPIGPKVIAAIQAADPIPAR